MRFEIPYWYCQKYLPTSRHRKPKSYMIEAIAEIDVPELTVDEFPVAMIVKDRKSVYEGAKTWEDFDNDKIWKFCLFEEEVRAYDNKLFMPVRITRGAALSTEFEPLDYIGNRLKEHKPYPMEEAPTQEPVMLENNSDQKKAGILKKAESYVIYDGKIWKECGEPMYEIATFGLGHNHGGTSMFIECCYNPNVPASNYFNALHKEDAVSYANKVAEERGDTDDIGKFGKDIDIKVLLPECVKRDPEKEHGDGDPFLNTMEKIIRASDSQAEAGILAIAYTASEVSRS